MREPARHFAPDGRALGGFALDARLFELHGHFVEGAREHAEFVVGFEHRARRQVAGRYGTRAFGQHQQGFRQARGEEECQRDGGEQRKQQCEGQRQRIEAFQAGAAQL